MGNGVVWRLALTMNT